MRNRQAGARDVVDAGICCRNTMVFAVAALEQARAYVFFDSRHGAGYAGLGLSNPVRGAMIVQLFGKSDNGTKIVQAQRDVVTHRKLLSR